MKEVSVQVIELAAGWMGMIKIKITCWICYYCHLYVLPG